MECWILPVEIQKVKLCGYEVAYEDWITAFKEEITLSYWALLDRFVTKMVSLTGGNHPDSHCRKICDRLCSSI